jgi:hypothetical protein
VIRDVTDVAHILDETKRGGDTNGVSAGTRARAQ